MADSATLEIDLAVRFVPFVRFGEGGGTAWTARMDAVHYLNEPERAARLIAPSSAPCPKPTRHAPPSMFFRRRRAASRAVIRDRRADRSRKLAVGDRMTEEFGGDESPSMESFPFYGHGVGLAFELPRISTVMSEPADIVEENMVFGVEALLSLGHVGAAFFEDIIIIGKDRNELLTKTPNYWW